MSKRFILRMVREFLADVYSVFVVALLISSVICMVYGFYLLAHTN